MKRMASTRKGRESKRGTGFSLPPSLVRKLKKIARQEDRPTSYFAEQAIREFLERREGAA
jgi:predicted transcriptional regulator